MVRYRKLLVLNRCPSKKWKTSLSEAIWKEHKWCPYFPPYWQTEPKDGVRQLPLAMVIWGALAGLMYWRKADLFLCKCIFFVVRKGFTPQCCQFNSFHQHQLHNLKRKIQHFKVGVVRGGKQRLNKPLYILQGSSGRVVLPSGVKKRSQYTQLSQQILWCGFSSGSKAAKLLSNGGSLAAVPTPPALRAVGTRQLSSPAIVKAAQGCYRYSLTGYLKGCSDVYVWKERKGENLKSQRPFHLPHSFCYMFMLLGEVLRQSPSLTSSLCPQVHVVLWLWMNLEILMSTWR